MSDKPRAITPRSPWEATFYCAVSLRDVGHGLCWRFERPCGRDESHQVNRAYDCEGSREADLLCHPSHSHAKSNLQKRADEIKGILHTPHEVLGYLFHKLLFIATPLTPRAEPITP